MLRLALSFCLTAPSFTLSPVTTRADGGELRELSYTDSAGPHTVRFELSGVTGDDEKSRSLKVVDRVAGEELWSAKDFVEACPFDLLLQLVDASIQVTDLDGDGVSEVSFAYLLTCRSDVSPANAKLLLFEGKTKYALRGFARDMGGGGTFRADPALGKGPKAFRSFMEAQWKKHLVDAFPPLQ